MAICKQCERYLEDWEREANELHEQCAELQRQIEQARRDMADMRHEHANELAAVRLDLASTERERDDALAKLQRLQRGE